MDELGSTYLAGCLGYSLGALTGKPPTAEERQIIVDNLREVAEDAKARGITMALEACNRYETHLYNTLSDTREAVLAIGADNMQLHADTYHMNIEEEGFYTPFVETGDVLGHVHMSESHRGLVGTGTVNWDEAFRGLKDANFSGNLGVRVVCRHQPNDCRRDLFMATDESAAGGFSDARLSFFESGGEKARLSLETAKKA